MLFGVPHTLSLDSDAYHSRTMHRIELGMAVRGVRGRRMGTVSQVFDDCFEVKRLREEGEPICIQADAIFTVDKREGVTLICSNQDVERYTHPLHPAG